MCGICLHLLLLPPKDGHGHSEQPRHQSPPPQGLAYLAWSCQWPCALLWLFDYLPMLVPIGWLRFGTWRLTACSSLEDSWRSSAPPTVSSPPYPYLIPTCRRTPSLFSTAVCCDQCALRAIATSRLTPSTSQPPCGQAAADAIAVLHAKSAGDGHERERERRESCCLVSSRLAHVCASAGAPCFTLPHSTPVITRSTSDTLAPGGEAPIMLNPAVLSMTPVMNTTPTWTAAL